MDSRCNYSSIEAVASNFNGNRALSSLDAEGCSEERMFRLGSLPRITSTNKRRYPDKESNNRKGGCFLEGQAAFEKYKATKYFWQWTIFAIPLCDLCVHGAKYQQVEIYLVNHVS
ncbi:hypothetical protein AABB24_030827 [Solanum stoloniferum]|uniref:Uncharacterized protein n=1 Tax=Solanum stoloniferum TaxID=62892 RepID=A0ABD2RRG1_9SOLN